MKNSRPLSPIALFVYNRLDNTQATIEHLKANSLASESVISVSESVKIVSISLISSLNSITFDIFLQLLYSIIMVKSIQRSEKYEK